MSAFDPAELRELGRRRAELREQDRTLTTRIRPLIIAAARAGAPQVDIARWARITRDAVAQIERAAGLPPRRPGGRPSPEQLQQIERTVADPTTRVHRGRPRRLEAP